MKKTEDQIILVTGALSGIGKAIAEKLTHEGATVIAIGRQDADLSKPKAISKLMLDIKTRYTTIDWIIHSAGFIDPNEPMGITEKNVEQTFAVNSHAYLHLFQESKGIVTSGMIVIGSTAGLFGNAQFPVYTASKGAVHATAKSIARAFADANMSSYCICPGPTNTPMRESMAHDAAKQQDPKVIADLVQKLISGSPEYKNGDTIIVRDNVEKLHDRLFS